MSCIGTVGFGLQIDACGSSLMTKFVVWVAFLFSAYCPCLVLADGEEEAALLPPAAKRVLDDAERAVAKNRKAFEAANNEVLDGAEKSLKVVMDNLTKDEKLEEALATKKLLGTFRENLLSGATTSGRPTATDASKRKSAAKPPARRGGLECNELFGFMDVQKVNEWWDFNEAARNHQLGTDGIRLNNGGTMQLRVGLVGDFEFGVIVKQHVWNWTSSLSIAGAKLDIGQNDPGPTYRIAVTRKGNQLFVNTNGKQTVIVVPESQADLPQYPSISCRGKLDVKSVGIKAAKVRRPAEE